jgi:hypothetical protein
VWRPRMRWLGLAGCNSTVRGNREERLSRAIVETIMIAAGWEVTYKVKVGSHTRQHSVVVMNPDEGQCIALVQESDPDWIVTVATARLEPNEIILLA